IDPFASRECEPPGRAAGDFRPPTDEFTITTSSSFVVEAISAYARAVRYGLHRRIGFSGPRANFPSNSACGRSGTRRRRRPPELVAGTGISGLPAAGAEAVLSGQTRAPVQAGAPEEKATVSR